jgi:hypothetical protein
MKTLVTACAAALIFSGILTSAASANDLAVSKSTLDSMGLRAMQEMSPADGLAVRGQGTGAGVWGGSVATWGGQTSSNFYSAGSSWLGQPSSAGGSSFSFGGNFQFSKFSW